MMTDIRIGSISISRYMHKHSGTMTVIHGDENATCLNLTKEDCTLFLKVAIEVFEKKRKILAESISHGSFEQLLEYDKSKTIDETPVPQNRVNLDDDIPF